MRTLGSVTGMKLPTGSYIFRRGNSEALDNSKCVHDLCQFSFELFADPCTSFISESQRNLILQHHNSTVFLKSYLSRYITSDTGAAYRGLKPQTALMRLASGMSRKIDRRRPRKLNDAQKAQVDRHPEVRLLCRRQKKMFQFIKDNYGPIASMKGTSVYNKYQKAYQAHRNIKRRQRRLFYKRSKRGKRGSSR